MAVTYPARKFGIKRGDSFEAVAQKSNNQCLAIHLPLLETTTTTTNTENTNAMDDIQTAYEKTYYLTPEQRQHCLATEVGRQRFPSQGKACLERYRLASSRIFNVVLETLQTKFGSDMILERASIDELFLDVTDYCWSTQSSSEDVDGTEDGEGERIGPTDVDGAVRDVMEKTVLVGKDNDDDNHHRNQQNNDDDDDPPDILHALHRGCWVAKRIRQAVWDELGFTLSAGISTSKLVAKLGATFGKPNGQAVIYPSCIPYVMDRTPIRKVRNLGGKLGKQVVVALEQVVQQQPPSGYTMGHVAQHLSVPQLAASGLGAALAQRVFDNARGIDEEVVKETVGALVQSITAFKSFVGTSILAPQVLQWLQLLATDVVQRVQQDVQRNKRYPKSCTVQYTYSAKEAAAASERMSALSSDERRRLRRKNRTTKSVRVPFPKQEKNNQSDASPSSIQSVLANRARLALLQREGNDVLLYRIGLAAVDFEQRGSIESYFSGGGGSSNKVKAEKQSTEVVPSSTASSENRCLLESDVDEKTDSAVAEMCDSSTNNAEVSLPSPCTLTSDEEMARKLQGLEQESSPKVASSPAVALNEQSETVIEVDKDLELARKLQASYDRENSVLTALDKRKPVKRARIDAFFRSSK